MLTERSVVPMPRKSFDDSVLGEFFWNSSDLLSVLGSDGSWLIVSEMYNDANREQTYEGHS